MLSYPGYPHPYISLTPDIHTVTSQDINRTGLLDGFVINNHGYPLTNPGYPLTNPGYPLTNPGYPLTNPGYLLTNPGYSYRHKPGYQQDWPAGRICHQ